ncbi:SAV_915 family protein [Rhodococcus sp. NPDC060090]|uniref:SAV_915 family protein n=1 Tax=Rhodococcus sp. NPDC060090 TaxID=3347056 RepID=UPI003645FFCD
MSEILYVPTRRRDESGQVQLEMRTLLDGRLALAAYTSLQELVRCCGPRQPWMGVDSAGLREIHRNTGYDLVLLDAAQPPPPPPSATEDESRRPRGWLQDPIGRTGTR